MKKISKEEKIIFIAAIVVFILSIWPRFIDIRKFLPYYSIDENDVVEWAVSFLGGDLTPHVYGYGTVYPYLLALIYKVQSFFSTGNPEEFIQKIFFEPTNFYYTARFFNSCLSIVLIWLTYLIGKKFFSRRVAYVALLLASFPFFEILVNFTVRIDTLLAVFGVSAVYFALQFWKSGRSLHYALAGLMVGLGIATKPLPGLLILPTMAIAHYLKTKRELEENSRKSGIASVCMHFLCDKKIYILLGMIFVGNFIGNPYSILHFRAFWNEQVATIATEGERYYVKGYDITRFLPLYGYAFVVVTCMAFIHAILKRRTGQHLIVMSYAVVYWLAFAKGSAREYWYVPIVPILLIVTSQFIIDISEKFKNNKMLYVGFSVLSLAAILFEPAVDLYSVHAKMNSKDNYREVHTIMSAYDWVLKNIPAGSKIMLYGHYTTLPHLVSSFPYRLDNNNLRKQIDWGEHLAYGRYKNKFYVDQFLKAYAKRVMSGIPTYNLQLKMRTSNNQTLDFKFGLSKDDSLVFENELSKVNYDYIIASEIYGPRKKLTFSFSESPYFQKFVCKKFSREDYPFGPEITIFKLN